MAVPVRQHTTGYDELIRGMSRQRNTLGQIVIDDVVGGKVEFIDLQKKRWCRDSAGMTTVGELSL